MVLSLVVLAIIAFLVFSFGACAKDIEFNPAVRVNLVLVSGEKGESYSYGDKDYSTKAGAVTACVLNKF